jgi:hypothetical protein
MLMLNTMWGLKPAYNYIIKKGGINFTTVPSDSSGKIQFSNSAWPAAQTFTVVQGTPAVSSIYDLNHDGAVNDLDMQLFIPYLNEQYTPLDLNSDGIVDILDAVIVAENAS